LTDGRLVVTSASTLADASRLASRTLHRLTELQRSPAPMRKQRAGGGLPRMSDASAADIDAAVQWVDRVGFRALGDDGLLPLVGEVNVEAEYSTGDSSVMWKPSMAHLRALATDARVIAERWARPAPIQELQDVAYAVRVALESVGSFHDAQIAMFERLTPAAIDSGRAAEISGAIQRNYQPLIDSMVAPARELLSVLEQLNRSFDT
jgi:hypothetical protein